MSKKVLVLGGTGLVGRNVIGALLDRGIRNIATVGLKDDNGWKKLQLIEQNNNVKVKKYKYDLLNPASKSRNFINTISAEITREEIRNSALYKIIRSFRPEYIVDGVNTATQCAYGENSLRKIDGAGTGLLMLLRYYKILFHLLGEKFWEKEKQKIHILQYVKVGTTGIGGMGLDIPFTHGEERPSLALMKKIAMAGSQTNILFAMRNSRGIAHIQEIIPATSIFQLSGFDPTRKEIDGGESQGYALEEFRLLTHSDVMGTVDAAELGKIIADALEKGKSKFDVLSAFSRSVITHTRHSRVMRGSILHEWTQAHIRRGTVSIAHGSLGPRRTRKLLFELHILLQCPHVWRLPPKQIQERVKNYVAQNAALREEMKHAGLSITTSTRSDHSDSYVDLSTMNISQWRKTLLGLGIKQRRAPIRAGDLLAQIIERRHDLRKIP